MRHNLTKRAAMLFIGLMVTAVCQAEWAELYDFEDNGIYYRYGADGQSVSVTYKRQSYNQDLWKVNESYAGDVVVPEQVTYQDVTYPVTAVDRYAFAKCNSLTSIQLPSSIKSIGVNAFWGDAKLKTINLPESITEIGSQAFQGCGIEEIEIPQNIVQLSELIFQGCGSLQRVVLNDGLLRIEPEAFNDCKALADVVLPNSLEFIGARAFRSCGALTTITIPENVSHIEDNAFAYSGLTTVSINCNLAQIENGEFQNIGKEIFVGSGSSGSVRDIYLSDYYTGIALCLNNAFNEVYSFPGNSSWRAYRLHLNEGLLTEGTIPEGIARIPASSFNGLVGVKSLVLPSTLQTIEERAFASCTDLETLSLPDALTTIGKYAFQSCTGLKEITFGAGIKSIVYDAFNGCTNLTKVDIGNLANWCSVDFDPTNERSHHYESSWNSNAANPLMLAKRIYLNGEEVNTLRIPNGVKKIADWAFLGCARFDKVVLPSSVESIGMYAFCNCVDLADISFARNCHVDSIDVGAFYGCYGLTAVALPESVRYLGRRCFYKCDQLLSVTIPEGVEAVPDYAFYQCLNLHDISLPEGLRTIGGWAFYECKALQRIDIPSSLTYIGANGFEKCSALTGVYITDLAAWCRMGLPGQDQGGGWATRYNKNNPLLFAHNLYLNNELVTDLVVPEGVEAVEALTFAGATCLKSVTIPEGCKRLGGGAFYNCPFIETIHLPASMETFETVYFTDMLSITAGPFTSTSYTVHQKDVKLYIKDLEKWINNLGRNFSLWDYSSKYHVSLYVNDELVEHLIVPETITKIDEVFCNFTFTSVTLPVGLLSIKNNTFNKCSKLNTIYSRSRFAPTGTTGMNLNTITALKVIYVPEGRAGNYKTSWADNAHLIVEAPEDINLTGNISAVTLTEKTDAHTNIYDDIAPYLDLTKATLDETVTAESLQDIADKGTIVFLPEGTEGIEGTNIVANGRTPKLILRDSTNFAAPYDFTADELEYQRYFPASRTEATTICLPYDMNELPQGMKVYQLTGQDTNDNAVFEEVDVIEANKPYVVTTTKNVDGLVGENVLVKATPTEMPDAGNEAFEFRGTLSTISHDDAADEEAYVLTEGRQWLSAYDANEDVYVPAGRAYLVPADAAFVSFGTVLNTTSHEDYLPGDVNGDNQVDLSDAIMVTYYSLHEVPSNFNDAAADMNGDGVIDLSDAIVIIYKSLGVK